MYIFKLHLIKFNILIILLHGPKANLWFYFQHMLVFPPLFLNRLTSYVVYYDNMNAHTIIVF